MIYHSFLIVLLGNLCLCLSQSKNYKQITGSKIGDYQRLSLRIVGYCALAISLALAFLAEGFVGLVYWCGLFTLAAVPIAFGLSYFSKLWLSGRQ